MRTYIFLMSAVALAVSGAATAATHCCAHRGDNKVAPENTIPAFELAVEKGAHQIEFDVRRTKDGYLVVIHDARVDRTTDGSGHVAQMTFEEIRALDAGSWFAPEFAGVQVPTLAETLAVIPRAILCNVHLKGDDELGAQVATTIVELDRLDHCFLACTLEQAEKAREVAPDIMICNMSRRGFDRELYIQDTIDFGAEFIQLVFRFGVENLEESVELLHKHDITVNVFGASEEENIRLLIEKGVDYILTDHLDLCLEIANEYGVPPLEINSPTDTAAE